MAMNIIRELARVLDLILVTRVLIASIPALPQVPVGPHAVSETRIKQVQSDIIRLFRTVIDTLDVDPNDPGSLHHRLNDLVDRVNLYRLRLMAGTAGAGAGAEELEGIETTIRAIARDLGDALAELRARRGQENPPA